MSLGYFGATLFVLPPVKSLACVQCLVKECQAQHPSDSVGGISRFVAAAREQGRAPLHEPGLKVDGFRRVHPESKVGVSCRAWREKIQQPDIARQQTLSC